MKDLNSEIQSTENARNLASYLRQFPVTLNQTNAEIAEKSGVSEIFVEKHIKKLKRFSLENNSVFKGAEAAKPPKFFNEVSQFFQPAVKNLLIVCIVINLIFTACGMAYDYSNGLFSQFYDYSPSVLATALYVTSFFFQWLLIFIRASLPELGKVILGNVIGNIILMMPVSLMFRGTTETIPQAISNSLFSLTINAIFFGIMGGFFTLAGRFFLTRREQIELRFLSRQELLGRLFDLESRISVYPRSTKDFESKKPSLPITQQIANRPILWAVLMGFFLSTLSLSLIDKNNLSDGFGSQVGFLSFLQLLLSFVQIAFLIALGALSKGFAKSVLHTFIYAICTLPASFMPFSPVREIILSNPQIRFNILLSILIYPLIYGIGGYFVQIWIQKNSNDLLLRQNDPEALLTEIMQIQYLLTPKTREISVMVVDVVGSRIMKKNTDPFVAEWSFREFQKLVQANTEAHNGQLFSTAGDGAVLIFSCPNDAISGAKSIQTGLAEFNQMVNKMADPFRCRIGIHCGVIVGDLEKIQYSEVIDIAAHTESVCPVGKLSITDSALAVSSSHELGEFLEEVDGHKVFSLEIIN